MGIPVIGCTCSVCTSESPCNQRFRPSGLLTINQKKILIDCGPDFRNQALKHSINHLDGIILTHAHHDHVAGIDELRVFYMRQKQPIPCLLSHETTTDLRTRFHYIFKDLNPANTVTSRLDLQILEGHRGTTQFLGFPIKYFSYEQAGMHVNGFRIGNFAYVSDIRKYPNTIFEDLQGVDILVLSALRFEPTPFHLGIDEAIAFANKVGCQHTWLTHIAHELDHEKTNEYLPPNVRMAYDGLEISFLPDFLLDKDSSNDPKRQTR
ncbi:MAG: MBL fold metallo-hydrolase [Parachlamydiaceae bacterium]|nr:MBL fold metallo-hydrolase [Parachlamydiaceae bacterium]